MLNSSKPSLKLDILREEPVFREYPLSFLHKLQFTEQSKIHHPEGNVWIHTMMVTDNAAKTRHKSKDMRVFMWAAFLHDIGKPATTKRRDGKITAYNHDKVGAKIAREFLEFFDENGVFIREVCNYVYFHMHPLFIVKKMPFANIASMKKSVDLEELSRLSFCDRTGRTGVDLKKEQSISYNFINLIK
ncbi:MAG: HDIG domain-containing protein [Defluviitaleaceae bacterium]|nr:HDIG domain-containing protein [Defluviitaleaceae bacterium]